MCFTGARHFRQTIGNVTSSSIYIYIPHFLFSLARWPLRCLAVCVPFAALEKVRNLEFERQCGSWDKGSKELEFSVCRELVGVEEAGFFLEEGGGRGRGRGWGAWGWGRVMAAI